MRALTRVATPENERALVDVALAGTAAHVERLVRAWRRAEDAAAAQLEESRHLRRSLSAWVDTDGMVVIRGRLTPELGAVVQRALEAAAERLFKEGQGLPQAQGLSDEVTPGQRRADALGRLAEVALSADLDAGTAGDRYQVVVHVDAVAFNPDAACAVGVSRTGSSQQVATAAAGEGTTVGDGTGTVRGGVVELDHGPVHVSAETSRRLACDASVVVMRHGTDGHVRDVGRRTRTIPPSIRRALVARDSTCQFPGGTARRCDAQHVEHSTPARTPRAPGAPAGLTAARHVSITCCGCVAGTIVPCTRADSRWRARPRADGCSIGPMDAVFHRSHPVL